MAEAIGQALPFAVAVALSPVPIVGIVVMLGTPRARVNAPAFVAGWILGLTAVGTVVLLASSGADASGDGGPAGWVSVLKLALGVLLLVVAGRQWRSRPRDGAAAEMPAWMEATDHFGPGRAVGLAVLLSAVNPKNLVLVVAAAAAIAQTGISSGDQAVALAVFVAVGTLGPALPVVLYFALGERSTQPLAALKEWMSSNNGAIMAVLCLVIGAKLIGDAIGGL